MTWPRSEDEEPLPELPPAEEADGEADESATPVEYDELHDDDPLEDAVASLGDDGLEVDLSELAADRLPLEEEAAGVAPDEDLGAELPELSLVADLEEGVVGGEDDADALDGVDTLAGEQPGDQGEEGPTEDDEELTADALPDLDADDEGEVDDAELYERGALVAEAHPRDLGWADEAWGVRLLAEGGVTSVALVDGAICADGVQGSTAFARPTAAELTREVLALAPLDAGAAAAARARRAAPPELPSGHVARGVGGCEELWIAVDDDGELTLASARLPGRVIPALPFERTPSEVAARDGLVALRVDEVGVYQVLPGAPAAERLEGTRGASAFTVMGARGARGAVVVSAHAEPGRVTLVAHGADGPRVVGALEARGSPAPASGAAAQLVYDPEGDCVYIATHLGLFVAWRPPRSG
ncbi:MAG TPA: hypothetical protein PK141_19945 [Polyangiaceae bacterium]|nr:hypothetical protein [Polyangiaceae bacterium]